MSCSEKAKMQCQHCLHAMLRWGRLIFLLLAVHSAHRLCIFVAFQDVQYSDACFTAQPSITDLRRGSERAHFKRPKIMSVASPLPSSCGPPGACISYALPTIIHCAILLGTVTRPYSP
ncbi:hypothetical protein F4808DRAFT_415307 [Astrocystis sublimbata]|nr:hypothetical protein F4808DRAFT_415307 [Astrocystis sublimbata]